MGVDLGERRIGIAVSDSLGVLAFPRTTVVRGGDPAQDRQVIVNVARESEVACVVVGLPVHLDGREGPGARAARNEAAALAALLGPEGILVETFDERLTTVSAERALRTAGRKGHARRRVVDQAAAAVLLQAWLDTRGPDVSNRLDRPAAGPGPDGE